MMQPKFKTCNLCAIIVVGVFLTSLIAGTNVDIIDPAILQTSLESTGVNVSFILNTLLLIILMAGCFVICNVFASWFQRFQFDTE